MAMLKSSGVAPLAGAWIEIHTLRILQKTQEVAPLAGAWIEILILLISPEMDRSRSPRGGVD